MYGDFYEMQYVFNVIPTKSTYFLDDDQLTLQNLSCGTPLCIQLITYEPGNLEVL